MKTPMQELIEQLKEERDGFLKLPPLCSIQERTENCFGSCIEIAERMLEKEKECFMFYGYQCCQMTKQKNAWSLEALFNKTFNTK